MDIYGRVEKLAKEQALSIREVGRRADVGETTIYKWKSGQIPNSEVLGKVADALNTSVDYLLGRTNDRYSLSNKEMKDVGDMVDVILDGLSNDGSVNFYGEPMDDQSKSELASVIRAAVIMNKERSKKNNK